MDGPRGSYARCQHTNMLAALDIGNEMNPEATDGTWL